MRIVRLPSLHHDQQLLIPRLEIASNLWSRTKGLLGRQNLEADQAMWILRCNSVHTFFMKFTIDLVFVDRDMRVKKTFSRVKPGRIVWPVWGASSVIELSAGFLETNPIHIGDKLNVDHPLS